MIPHPLSGRYPMDEPLKLVEVDESSDLLSLIKANTNFLDNEDRPVTVVAGIGELRIGKSYLLRWLINASSPSAKGFKIDCTTRAVTKGVWYWKGDFPGDPNRCMILMDFEGLFDPRRIHQENDNHDLKLFVAAVLWSDVLIFNIKGINTSTLGNFDLFSRITTEFQGFEIFPQLALTIRDFTLDLEGEGKTPNTYMEECLSEKNSGGKFIQENFKNRQCFTFPVPTTKSKLKTIESIPETDIDEDFVKEARHLVDFIKNAEPKKIGGSEVIGSDMTSLLEMFLSGINSEDINIPEVHVLYEKNKNQNAYHVALAKYKYDFQKMVKKYPVSEAKEISTFNRCLSEAKKCYRSKSTDGEARHEMLCQLEAKCEEDFKNEKSKNFKVSTKKCKKVIEELKAMHFTHEERYLQPEGVGVKNLQEDIAKIKSAYENRIEELGPAKEKVYFKFEQTEVQDLVDKCHSMDRISRVDWIVKFKTKPGVPKSRAKARLEEHFQRIVEGRKKSLQLLTDFINDKKMLENSTRTKKMAANGVSVIGNILTVSGGIVLLVTTGGAAAPVLLGVAIVAGVASGVASVAINHERNAKLKKYTEQLIKGLSDDTQFSRQFEKELEDAKEEEDFEFEFYLKTGVGKYPGRGVDQLKRMAEKILPSLHRVYVQDRGARELLKQLLTAITAVNNVREKISKEGSFKEKATEFAAKAVGGVAIGLGELFLVLDIYQIYKDYNLDSIADIFEKLADAISYSARTEIEDAAREREIEAELKNVAEEVKSHVAELANSALGYFNTHRNVLGLNIEDEKEMKQSSLALEYIDTSKSREK